MKVFASTGLILPAFAIMFALCAMPQANAQTLPATPADGSRIEFRELVDGESGVALRLPDGMFSPAQKSALGTAWSTRDQRLKVATLNFKNKRTLRSLYQAIRDRPGRTVTKDTLNDSAFELQGRDLDGSVFFVRAEAKGGEVRGLSVTCENTGELLHAAQTILQSFRAFPAVSTVEASPPKPAGSCLQEAASLSRQVSGVSLKLETPAQLRAGESIPFSWETAERFPPGTPVYAILSISGEARLEVPPPSGQAKAEPAQDSSEGPDTPNLPGFIALRPQSLGPKGIGFGAGTTRVFIPLHESGTHLNGTLSVRLYVAGSYALESAVVARTVCGESALKSGPAALGTVLPAGGEIVVQDPYDIAVPKSALLSSDGHYLLQSFENYYRVFDVASGAKLIDRPGQDPNFSPTGRFVAANTGAGETYEIVDLLSREPVASVHGLLVAWAEDDAYVIAASAGNWAPLTLRPTLISLRANADASPPSPGGGGDSLSLSVSSPQKNAPSWEVFGIRIDVDAGVAVFSNVTSIRDKNASKDAEVFELASGQRAPSTPLEKGWHARGPVRFSHIFDFARSSKIYNPEWAREQAKSPVLKELSKLKFVHRTFDPRALADLRKSVATAPSGDWRVSRQPGEAIKSATIDAPLTQEFGRFGIQFAPEVPRQDFPPPYSALRSTVDGDALGRLASDAHVQAFAKGMKERLSREVPSAAAILKEGMLSSENIDLASDLEGLWRWDAGGRPLWLLQGVEGQGSGGFAQISSWLLKGGQPDGKVEAFLTEMPEDYNPHITDVDDNAIRLKARLFLDRYLIAGMSGPKLISITDLRGDQPPVLLKNIPQADLLADVRLTSDARHVIQIGSDGQFFFHDMASRKMVLAGRYADGEIIFYTPEAYYWSSYEGAHFVQLRFPGLPELASFRQYASVLNRPDFVKAQLGESPPQLPQPKLTPPPSVSVALVDEPGTMGQDIRLRVRAGAANGLERLRLYYDGQLAKDEPLTGTGFQGVVTVPRSPNARWLTALAIDRNGVLSAARALRMEPSGPGTNTLRAVLVGVDKYTAPGIDLTYAKSDAVRLAAAIQARRGVYYPTQNVELLSDKEAASQAIQAALDRAATAAVSGDTILFFFAGHGVQGKDGRYYLASHDLQLDNIEGTGVPWSRISAILAKSPARAVVILDSCHAGLSGAEGLATNDDAVSALLSGSHAPVLVLAASKGRELSLEGPEWRGGVFTYALIKVLRETAGPTNGVPQAIDVSSLYRKLREILATETNKRQTPWLARQDLIGDFALF